MGRRLPAVVRVLPRLRADAVSDYPRSWYWGDDPDECIGKYVGISEGYRKTGEVVPIITLEVDGEPRAIWLFGIALRDQFLREIELRPSRDLDPGETVTIRRGEERQSAAHPDRHYRVFEVSFEHKRKPTAMELLAGPLRPTQAPPSMGGPATDDDDGVPY